MSSGKHASDKESEFEFDFNSIRNIIIIIAILVILIILIGIVFGIYKLVGKRKETKTEQISTEVGEIKDNTYMTLGKIVIDKIEVEQPILDSVEEEALEKGVIKLYGDALNQEGNFCIAGHNYEGIFKRLEELEIGDTFKILDKDEQSTQYKITKITSIEPTDLELLRKQAGKTEITLITCENYSTKRLVVKAEMLE